MEFYWSNPNEKSAFYLDQTDRKHDDVVEIAVQGFDSISYSFSGVSIPYQLQNNILIENSDTLYSESTESEDDEYLHLLKCAIDKCRTEEFTKVVISRNEILNGVLKTKTLFYFLTQEYPECFVYWLVTDDYEYLGATPEKLFSLVDGEVSTMSLAGTMNLEDGLNINNWQNKERVEQLLVTEYIIDKLNGISQTIELDGPQVIQNGNVCHLRTLISAKLKEEKKEQEILSLLHPTPAVCGIPTQKAQEWIIENENRPRELYTGYIGIKQNNRSDYFVNLRCLKYQNSKTTIYVGGGITKDSIPQDELEETKNKAHVLLSQIQKVHKIDYY
jgi:isochorismate synthase